MMDTAKRSMAHGQTALLAAILKQTPGPVPAEQIRMATTHASLELWPDATLDEVATAWLAAVRELRDQGVLLEDTRLDTWAPGDRGALIEIFTGGWPDDASRDALARRG